MGVALRLYRSQDHVAEAGVGRFAHVRDPAGTRLELWEPQTTGERSVALTDRFVRTRVIEAHGAFEAPPQSSGARSAMAGVNVHSWPARSSTEYCRSP